MNSIDVVIPTFNEYERLLAAVKSVADQTLGVRRIFIVDDGSRPEIKSAMSSSKLLTASNVELLFEPHRGLPGVLRKIGVEKSTAEWVAFLDADDIWQPGKLQIQMLALAHTDANLVCSNAKVVQEGNEKPLLTKSKVKSKQLSVWSLLWRNRIVNSSVLVRRSALAEVGLYADSWRLRGVEDYATWLRIISKSSVVFLEENLVEYTFSPDSLSRTEIHRRPEALSDFRAWLWEAKTGKQLTKGRSALIISTFILEMSSRVVRGISQFWCLTRIPPGRGRPGA